MRKPKQNTYTCLLLATCFVASPFIYHKLWKNSAEAKKINEIPVSNVSDDVYVSEAPGELPQETATVPGGIIVQVPTDASGAPDPSAAPVPVPAPTEAPPADYVFVSGDETYFDDALFIGDSRTVGISEYGTLKNADYFCSVGMMASRIENEVVNGVTFDQLIDSKQYGKIYVMLGINEVGNDFQFTLTQYRAVVERLKAHQPNALIVVQANLHVAKSAETNIINNERINYLNSLIEGLADNKKVFYIDINEVYDDKKGYLTESYTSDGVHPLAMYYREWCEWLCTKEIVPSGRFAVGEIPGDAAEVIYTEEAPTAAETIAE